MLRRVGGDALARDMAALYVDALAARLAAVRAALAPADRDALAHPAHDLRASCGQLGATEAAELCRDVERRARADDLAAIAPLVGRVERACAAHRAGLARELTDRAEPR